MICEQCGKKVPVYKTTRKPEGARREYRCKCGYTGYTLELPAAHVQEYQDTIAEKEQAILEKERELQD